MVDTLAIPGVADVYVASSEPFFTPSTIVVSLMVLALTATLLVPLGIFTHRRYFRLRTTPRTKAVGKGPSTTGHVRSSASSPTSTWLGVTRMFSRRPTEADEELPWPLLSAVPALRPKEPFHRRVLKACVFWRKDEVKREPFTLVDAMRAIDEVNARRARSATSRSYAQMSFDLYDGRGRTPEPIELPEIVVYSCAGTRSAPIVDGSEFEFTPTHVPWSPVSPASVVSEPDSPIIVTPQLASVPRAYLPSQGKQSGGEWTRPRNFEHEVVDLERQSRSPRSTASSRRESLKTGLGFVVRSHSESGTSKDPFDDADHCVPTTSSVVDLVEVLQSLSSEDDLTGAALASKYSKRFSPIVDAFDSPATVNPRNVF